MAVLFIALAVVAAVVANGSPVFVPAVVNAIAAFWSNGVMMNFVGNPQAAPNFATVVSMITTVLSIAFLALGLVLN